MTIQHWHNNFKTLRLSMGLSQKRMVELLGVSQSLVNLLESGKRHFTESLLERIAMRCNVPLERIILKQ